MTIKEVLFDLKRFERARWKPDEKRQWYWARVEPTWPEWHQPFIMAYSVDALLVGFKPPGLQWYYEVAETSKFVEQLRKGFILVNRRPL